MKSSYNKGKKSNKGSAAVMFTMATLLCLYVACTVPQINILMYFICSLFIMGIMLEKMFLGAAISFIAVLFLGFIIVPEKYYLLPYLIFFGHYGIFKFFVDARVENIIGATIVKLVYYNIALYIMYMFDNDLITGGLNLPIWLIIVLAEIIFLVYDFLFTKLSTVYYERGRQTLLNVNRYD